MATGFSVGDVVKLNSGSPPLTVISQNYLGVTVTWIGDYGKVSTAEFPFDCVTKFEDGTWKPKNV